MKANAKSHSSRMISGPSRSKSPLPKPKLVNKYVFCQRFKNRTKWTKHWVQQPSIGLSIASATKRSRNKSFVLSYNLLLLFYKTSANQGKYLIKCTMFISSFFRTNINKHLTYVIPINILILRP